MNTLAYMSQKPETVAPKVESLLRAELGASSPLAYEIQEGDAGKTTAAGIALEGLSRLFVSRPEARLFSIVFKPTQPRAFSAEFHMNRQGVGCHAGSILYTTILSKPIKGTVWLEDAKAFSASKFASDPDSADVAARLSADKTLLKAANGFARVKGSVGGLEVTIPRFFKMAPEDGKAKLVGVTIPRSYAMGFKIAPDASEFCRIAEMIEAAI